MTLVQIMNTVGMKSNNIVNSVSVFNESVVMNSNFEE